MPSYSDFLLNYFYNTPHQGRLPSLPTVVSALTGSTDQEEAFQLFLQVESRVIIKARFLASGSVPVIAGGEWLCDILEGQSVSECDTLTVSIILEKLQLPSVYIHIAQLLLSALQQCLQEKRNAS